MIPVVDLFAGPGGLAEGFSSCEGRSTPAFNVVVSAEKDKVAHRTLRLRAFYRSLQRRSAVPDSYYEYLAGRRKEPFDSATSDAWHDAEAEALNLTLGERRDDAVLKTAIGNRVAIRKPWVLIGGPPCQAYSLVGRSRNAGIKGYRPELDKRNFLYLEYLQILAKYRPSVFVMENVKGLLSSNVAGNRIFHQMLRDLSKPSRACEYAIYSLVSPAVYRRGQDPGTLDLRSYVLRCENYGIPQRRHRVILIGVRKDLDAGKVPLLEGSSEGPVLFDAIGDLAALRSGLSQGDSDATWSAAVTAQAQRVRKATHGPVRSIVEEVISAKRPSSRGGQCVPRAAAARLSPYARRLSDQRLVGTLNHSTRGHIPDDLGRYLFLAAYGKVNGRSPSAADFPATLAPKHKNWDSGDFADRFRVQLSNDTATTIMSHISKDGHYYVHPEPEQCRSFTVREAARIQSFPDNYFFEGGRTAQFTQVGNAVPPLVAKQIAEVVRAIVS